MQQFYSNVCIPRAVIQEGSPNTFTAHTYLGCLRVLIEHFWKLCMISLLEISSQARSNHLWRLQNFHIVYFCNIFYHEVLYCFCPPLYLEYFQFSSVHFSHSVVSDSLQAHESQHTRPPCPSPTPGVYPNSCPLSQWCHPTISSSVIPFSSCPQPLPASGSFPMSQLFA